MSVTLITHIKGSMVDLFHDNQKVGYIEVKGNRWTFFPKDGHPGRERYCLEAAHYDALAHVEDSVAKLTNHALNKERNR